MNSRNLLALIFLLAAIPKILWPQEFVQNILTFHILPDIALNAVALTLPWLELLVSCLLLCNVWTGPALFITNAMLATFLGALISAYVRGIDVHCGCFGSSASSGDMHWYLIRDTAFMGLGLYSAWKYRHSK